MVWCQPGNQHPKLSLLGSVPQVWTGGVMGWWAMRAWMSPDTLSPIPVSQLYTSHTRERWGLDTSDSCLLPRSQEAGFNLFSQASLSKLSCPRRSPALSVLWMKKKILWLLQLSPWQVHGGKKCRKFFLSGQNLTHVFNVFKSPMLISKAKYQVFLVLWIPSLTFHNLPQANCKVWETENIWSQLRMSLV